MKSPVSVLGGVLLLFAAIQNSALAAPAIWEPIFGPSLGLSDDSTTSVGLSFTFNFQGTNYTSVFVSSNGFLAFGSNPGSQCCDGNLSSFLSGPPRISVAWGDQDPGAGGAVRFMDFGTKAVFTWDGVPEFSNSSPNTYQIQLFADGTIVFGYDVLNSNQDAGGHRHHVLIGITEGGGAADPGEVDFASANPFIASNLGTTYEFFARGPNGATGPNPDPFNLDDHNIIFRSQILAIPEPASLAAFGVAGLMGFGTFLVRRRRKATALAV